MYWVYVCCVLVACACYAPTTFNEPTGDVTTATCDASAANDASAAGDEHTTAIDVFTTACDVLSTTYDDLITTYDVIITASDVIPTYDVIITANDVIAASDVPIIPANDVFATYDVITTYDVNAARVISTYDAFVSEVYGTTFSDYVDTTNTSNNDSHGKSVPGLYDFQWLCYMSPADCSFVLIVFCLLYCFAVVYLVEVINFFLLHNF